MANGELTVSSLYAGGTHVVKFGSPTCGPCRTASEIINRISADDRFNDVSFWDVNVVDPSHTDLVRTLGIRTVPVVVLVKNGQNRRILIGGDIDETKIEDTLLDMSENEDSLI